MRIFRLIYRSLSMVLILIIGVVLTPMLQTGRLQRHGLAATTNTLWHRLLARALGIRLIQHGTPPPTAMLYVANHISWFDITAIGSRAPIRFLSKAEVKHWPVVGWLASRAGTLYIKRGAHASQDALIEMAGALKQDQNICLFPEGTTTDGTLKRFHGRLLQSAIDAGKAVQPVALYYPPQRFNDDIRMHEDILYIGETTMIESLKNVLTSPRIIAELHFLEPIDTANMSRDELTAHCEQVIRDKIESRHLLSRANN